MCTHVRQDRVHFAESKFGKTRGISDLIFIPQTQESKTIVGVKTDNEKSRLDMKVQAFCEEKGLRSLKRVFGYAEFNNQCWQAEKWLLHHLICIFSRWSPKHLVASINVITSQLYITLDN